MSRWLERGDDWADPAFEDRCLVMNSPMTTEEAVSLASRVRTFVSKTDLGSFLIDRLGKRN